MGITNYSRFDQTSLYQFFTDYVGDTAILFEKINTLVGVSDEEKTSLNFFLIMFKTISRFPEYLKIGLDIYNQNVAAWSKVIEHAKETGGIKSTSTSAEIADLFLYCTDDVYLRYINNEKNNSYDADLLKAFDTVYNNIKT